MTDEFEPTAISKGRPHTEPVHHGSFVTDRVYLKGDTVEWDGVTYRALADFRSGLLSPPMCVEDEPGEWWVVAD